MADTLTPTQPATPSQVAWLRSQLPEWQRAGLVGESEGAAIIARYRAVKRLSLGRLMLFLGAAFVGVGVIWLVAANLDQFSPMGRFLVVTGFWLAATAAAELLIRLARHRIMSPVTGAARGLSALLFGAVIFQAAQSLQVPAYEPSLIGYWGLGALLYAYAVRGLSPLVVGVAASLTWFIWQVVETSNSGLGAVLAMLLAGTIAAGLSVLHERWDLPGFLSAWREVAAALLLVGLFVAAVPDVNGNGFSLEAPLLAGGAVAAVLVVVALLRVAGNARFEPLAAAVVVLLGWGLVSWDPETRVSEGLGFGDWAHAALSVVVYVAVAGAVAALGILRDSDRLTWFAMATLVVFTTFQSFAVFAAIIEGAWLFLVLGLIFLGSGYLFDRARRELTETLEGASS